MTDKTGYRAPKGSAERTARDIGARKRAQEKHLKEIMGEAGHNRSGKYGK